MCRVSPELASEYIVMHIELLQYIKILNSINQYRNVLPSNYKYREAKQILCDLTSLLNFKFLIHVALFFSLLLDLFHTLTNLPVISFSNSFLLQVFGSSLVDSKMDSFSYLMHIKLTQPINLPVQHVQSDHLYFLDIDTRYSLWLK